jgi:hypothetical protein
METDYPLHLEIVSVFSVEVLTMLMMVILLLEEETLLFVLHFLEGCNVLVSLLFLFSFRDRPTKNKYLIKGGGGGWSRVWIRHKGRGANQIVLAKSCENE